MKIGIIVIAHDGLQYLLTGVGVVVNSFIESFQEIKERCKLLRDNQTSLICISPYINKNSCDFNKEIRKMTEESCKKNNGYLKEIETNSDGSSESSIWGGPSQWRKASLNAAIYIKEIEKEYDRIYVFCHDTIFSLVHHYLKASSKIQAIWVPHSLGKVFTDEYTDTERLEIEEQAITSINNSENGYLGYIGNSFKSVLMNQYGAKDNKLLPFINGIYNKSRRYNKTEENLNRYGIPNSKKIIFAWGRCVDQKGFDLLIPAYQEFLEKSGAYHLLLLMPSETSNKEYLDKIKEQLTHLPRKKYTAIFKFDAQLPFNVLKDEKLEIVIFPSRFEGNPITPLEALSFCKNSVRMIYSKIPPLIDLFKGIDLSFPCDLNQEDLFRTIDLAAHTHKKRKSSYKKDIIENYADGFSRIL